MPLGARTQEVPLHPQPGAPSVHGRANALLGRKLRLSVAPGHGLF